VQSSHDIPRYSVSFKKCRYRKIVTVILDDLASFIFFSVYSLGRFPSEYAPFLMHNFARKFLHNLICTKSVDTLLYTVHLFLSLNTSGRRCRVIGLLDLWNQSTEPGITSLLGSPKIKPVLRYTQPNETILEISNTDPKVNERQLLQNHHTSIITLFG